MQYDEAVPLLESMTEQCAYGAWAKQPSQARRRTRRDVQARDRPRVPGDRLQKRAALQSKDAHAVVVVPRRDNERGVRHRRVRGLALLQLGVARGGNGARWRGIGLDEKFRGQLRGKRVRHRAARGRPLVRVHLQIVVEFEFTCGELRVSAEVGARDAGAASGRVKAGLARAVQRMSDHLCTSIIIYA